MNEFSRSRGAPLKAGLGLLLFVAAVCTVPYHVPLPPSFSDSYIFGFNNRMAVLLALVAALAAGWFLPEVNGAGRSGKPLGASTLGKALAGTLLLGLAGLLLLRRLDGFLESAYTVDRVRLLLEGRSLYRDFEFAYGPLLLYGPATLVRVFGMGVSGACALFWVLVNLVGVAELYVMLRWSGADAAAQRRVMLLLLVLITGVSLATGTHGCAFRFLTPGFLAMALQRELARAQSDRQHALRMLLLLLGVGVALLISPDMGLALLFGFGLYLLRFGRLSSGRNALTLAGTVAGSVALIWLAGRFGELSTMRDIASGGFNMPIMPAPHLLVFFLAAAVAAPFLLRRFLREEGSALLALGCVALAMLPSALGRCDVSHVTLSGIGVLLIALLLCEAARGSARLLAPAVLLAFFVLPLVFQFRTYVTEFAHPVLAVLIHEQLGTEKKTGISLWAEKIALRMPGHLSGYERMQSLQAFQTAQESTDVLKTFGMPAGTVFQAPFGFRGGHTGPYHTPAVEQGYYAGMQDVLTTPDVERKLAEVQAHPERPLLLQPGDAESCTPGADAARTELRMLFAFPYSHRAAHPNDVREPLCRFIKARYVVRQTPSQLGYEVWMPKR